MNFLLKQHVFFFCLSFFSAASIESLLFRTCTSGVRILRLSACEVICMTGQHRRQKLSKDASNRRCMELRESDSTMADCFCLHQSIVFS